MGSVTVNSNQYRRISLPLIMAIANHILKEIGFVEQLNARLSWDRSQWQLSPGMLAKAMVLATFTDMRAPLVHVSARFTGLDTEYLFGDGVNSNDINEYNLGQMLDRLSEQDCNELYRTLALTVVTLYRIIVNRLHADTTTISFYGEYDFDLNQLSEAEQAAVLAIDRGYNKDGRPQCNQVVVGQIVNEDGILLASDTLDGHTSDIDWNRRAIDYVRAIQENLSQAGVFVADSKLICEEHFRNLMQPASRVTFVSRCPANFAGKLESRLIEQAYARNQWQPLGQFHDGKAASQYEAVGFTADVFGFATRLLVIRSSSLAAKVDQQIAKERLGAAELAAELEKKSFKCLPDVEAEWQRFCQNRKTRLFIGQYQVETVVEDKWPRGRRGPDTQPVGTQTSYRIKVTELAENPQQAGLFRQTESCFMLISNVEAAVSDRDLLGIYKGQQVVENSFQLLKEPCLASVIYLKNENRIRALTMLLDMALLVRSLIQYRMRQGLRTYEAQNPKRPLKAGWGKKKLEAPTFKLLFESCRNNDYLKTGPDTYSFDFHSTDNEFQVTTLLNLLGLGIGDLV